MIRTVYEQQKYMYDNRTHSVPDRIVSVSQPFVRPIVRGKAGKPVEFGAKLDISDVDGWTRLECYRLHFIVKTMIQITTPKTVSRSPSPFDIELGFIRR